MVKQHVGDGNGSVGVLKFYLSSDKAISALAGLNRVRVSRTASSQSSRGWRRQSLTWTAEL
jgi:hypothetical protein